MSTACHFLGAASFIMRSPQRTTSDHLLSTIASANRVPAAMRRWINGKGVAQSTIN